MLSNFSASINDDIIIYPTSDSTLPFSEYIALSRALIEERRRDLHKPGLNAKMVIDTNSPFELYPAHPIRAANGRLKYGALLIHGLFDCPFSLRDISLHLQANGALCRAILLPGHGTVPSDLLHVTYHDWIQAVRYGIDTLRQEVDQIFLVGYSTGAALSLYHALQDTTINGLVLLAPAIRIKAPVDTIFNWHNLVKWISNNRQWIYREDEVDYAKYLSVAFNPVYQVNKLTDVVNDLHRNHTLACPVFMTVSREDETISSHTAVDFFTSLHNQNNKLLLYTSYDHVYPDARILTRASQYPNLHINHLSHVGIPFSPNNHHYGQHGDYIYASHIDSDLYTYGAYNRIEENTFDLLYKLKLVKQKRRQLTYNPDFEFMTEMLTKFIIQTSS